MLQLYLQLSTGPVRYPVLNLDISEPGIKAGTNLVSAYPSLLDCKKWHNVSQPFGVNQISFSFAFVLPRISFLKPEEISKSLKATISLDLCTRVCKNEPISISGMYRR